MKVLLHACCGPCTAFPLAQLQEEGHEVEVFFFNPNIHPYREFRRRVKTMKQYAELVNVPCECDDDYDLKGSLEVLMQATQRCEACYLHRLERAAGKARSGEFDAFSTTLLVSPYQDHGLVRNAGKRVAERHGVPFLYRDFRPGWEKGVAMAKRAQLYRQPYCGCVFSEYERFGGGDAG